MLGERKIVREIHRPASAAGISHQHNTGRMGTTWYRDEDLVVANDARTGDNPDSTVEGIGYDISGEQRIVCLVVCNQSATIHIIPAYYVIIFRCNPVGYAKIDAITYIGGIKIFVCIVAIQ